VKIRLPTVLFAVSIVLNVALLALFALALSSKTASLSYFNLDEQAHSCTTAAAVVSIPGSAAVVFNPVEITLKKNDLAALQFSAVTRRVQSNWLITALYDHAVIAVSQTGYGILITALQEGETVMQTVTGEGVRDIARITVIE
jgi:hypothetical protein